MRGLVAFGLLSLLAGSVVEARQQPAGPATAAEPFARGRELLTDRRYDEAAAAFQEYLSVSGLGKFTIRVAVYCDVSNLDAHLDRSGNPPELFVLPRPVHGQICYGLFWGLFSSRGEADAALAALPPALRTEDRGAAPIASLLVPGGLMATRPPAPPPPGPAEAPAARPPVAVAPPPQETPPTAARPPVTKRLPPAAPPVRVEPGRAVRVPRAEIAAGYSYLWDDSLGQLDLSGSFNLGWVLSGNFNVTDNLGIVGEASGHYNWPNQDLLGSPVDAKLSLLGLHGGLRYTDRDNRAATPYAQVLLGATRFSISDTDGSVSETDFSIQPGVGVVFRVSENVGLDLGGDYRLVFTDPYKTNEFRLHAGVAFGVGRR